MIYENIKGVPKFIAKELDSKRTKYCVCIPVINEGERIKKDSFYWYQSVIDANGENVI